MKLTTLIDAQTLAKFIAAGECLVVDCRFDLADPTRSEYDYQSGHIPNALYADLNRDLSDLSKRGLGRHPLPDATVFSSLLGRWGWTAKTPVIIYDNANGALAAARLWWMLRLAGQHEVAVLDGGLAAWKAAGLLLSAEMPQSRPATSTTIAFDLSQIVYSDALVKKLDTHSAMLLDARAAPRFRGETETIDPVAGHVPGARNRPFSDNLAADGRFKSSTALHAEFAALIGERKANEIIHMCGSGVTACHNLLAMEHAGLVGARIYAPSWSGWISDSTRPVAVGDA